LFDGSSP